MHNYLKDDNVAQDTESLSINVFAGHIWMPVLIVFIFFLAIFSLGLVGLEVNSLKEAIEHRWASLWSLSISFSIISLIWSVCNSYKIIKNHSEYIKAGYVIFFLIILLFSSICISTCYIEYQNWLVGCKEFFFAGATAMALLEDNINKSMMPTISMVVPIIEILAIVAILLIAVAVSLLTMDPRDSEDMIRQKSTEAYNSLYSSTILLTAGVLELYCLFSWASVCGTEADKYIRDSIVITAGLFFTLMLGAAYIPLFIRRNEMLRNRLIKKGFRSRKEIDDWYAVNLLKRKAGTDFFSISAFLLPVIAGTLANVLSGYIN
uniref:Uncharacterized protein n=1 Tax=Candidatus Kentrum sp. MB TaxID=2138164 RepID=A0A450XCI3_9GAMM|nr:MAG: hypothetical protein BECKMB1821G_GA0114241_102443 [Candidatus Kentron sp. MB]VFK31235.1 MAG: hypothetical protein BECKMB1821I_GA0114274_102142 [Candidatus Kentron sp. MB]VFK75409.1 MAG: hypothetical protein BECKMB1821H_GA0114242_102143 [Candidatus Kentron sp. MB]